MGENSIKFYNIIITNMHVKSARDPYYPFDNTDYINLIVDFEEKGELPFTAFKNDTEPHGRDLWQRAINGEFGLITPYTPPPPPTYEEVAQNVLQKRDNLLKNSDWTQLNDVPENIKIAWIPYRQALRDITSQEEYPYNIIWPIPPS